MAHIGDITKLHGGELPPVDIITFGSPCQDLSTANGNRKGLEGARSGLFMEAIRIIKEMRGATNGKYPRYAVFENVIGAFSSAGGGDFRQILQAFCRVKDGDSAVPLPTKGKWAKAAVLMETGIPSRIGLSARNFGECPNVAVESSLSQILEERAPDKYCLSARACQGILNRAARRGKALPPMLREALEAKIRAEQTA